MPLRDPHNAILYLLLYHGLLGLALYLLCVIVYWRPFPREPLRSLTAVPAIAYGAVAMFGVLLSSPFGALPIATFTAFSVSRYGLTGRLADSGTATGTTVRFAPMRPEVQRTS